MRTKILYTLVALMLGSMLQFAVAHDPKNPGSPDPSPTASLSQSVGHAKVSMSYGRPGVKDRKVWGELVPYNGGDPRPWVAGANGSTTIEFDHDVKINGQDLPAGKYGLHMIPTEKEWTVIFNSDSSRFGIMSYSQDKDALRVTATPEASNGHQEWLLYEIEKTGDYTANVNLLWEGLKVGFAVETPETMPEK